MSENATTKPDSVWDDLWQTDTDWVWPATDLERFQAAVDELVYQIDKDLKMMPLLESIAAWLVRRITSVVRLATKLLVLVLERWTEPIPYSRMSAASLWQKMLMDSKAAVESRDGD